MSLRAPRVAAKEDEMNETLEQLLTRDLEAWILAQAAIAKAKAPA
jgi:hypothetical protein